MEQVRDVDDALEAARTFHEEVASERDRLEAEVDTLQADIDYLEDQLAGANARIAELESEVE